ncbi:peptidoglycan-binding domain-containing protein [Alteribacillus bidgolensis]|uniref:N-acetylmuramoyl-L-alanine amidase n=1 Tax=Alteribacillus bidgolensis TaxID=930129 RepID=A0A1G8FV18_9BACI|nr:peptidoglycan-binding protein [Alteribacillus bidgolensis]SDH85983.1 N-acetylmuramoyl-L-alanine amidase [Alteribacillus bidgolensis]
MFTFRRLNRYMSILLAWVVLASPTVGEAAFGDQNLYKGMQHDDVVVLQDQLKSIGLFQYHTSTGYFGPITYQAVIDFQQEQNIDVDGIVGPETFSALKNRQTTIESNQILHLGSRGQSVVNLQNRLKLMGFYPSKVDGIYGPITKQAVIDFQKDHELLVDGIAGPQTLKTIEDLREKEKEEANENAGQRLTGEALD